MADYVGVSGLDEVLKNLKNLEPEMKRKALLAGARAGAGVFRKAIVSRAPEKTGALKKAIGVKQMSKRLATIADIVGAMVVIRTGGSRTKKHKIGYRDPWYWFLQEYGYSAGGRWRTGRNRGLTRSAFRARNRRQGKKVPGKYFVKRGFNANADRIGKAYKDRIVKFVDKYNGR